MAIDAWTDTRSPHPPPVAACRYVIAEARALDALPCATAVQAVTLARCLVECWPARDGYATSGTFVASLTVVFAAYPHEIGAMVCHPLDGLPARLRFPPSICEVKAALDGIVVPIRRAAERAERALAVMAERAEEIRHEAEREAVAPERRREIADMLRSAMRPVPRADDA